MQYFKIIFDFFLPVFNSILLNSVRQVLMKNTFSSWRLFYCENFSFQMFKLRFYKQVGKVRTSLAMLKKLTISCIKNQMLYQKYIAQSASFNVLSNSCQRSLLLWHHALWPSPITSTSCSHGFRWTVTLFEPFLLHYTIALYISQYYVSKELIKLLTSCAIDRKTLCSNIKYQSFLLKASLKGLQVYLHMTSRNEQFCITIVQQMFQFSGDFIFVFDSTFKTSNNFCQHLFRQKIKRSFSEKVN